MYVPTDLHGHTYFSDGKSGPGQFATFRRDLGMKVIAVSDHDVFRACREVANVARTAGMEVVPAAEITSVLHFGTDRAEQVHVLAYFPPSYLDDGRLEETFLYRRGLEVQKKWKAFILSWIDGLAPDDRAVVGMDGSLEKIPAEDFLGLQQLIDVITLRRPAVFDAFIAHHVRFWMDDAELFGWTPEELVDQIRADGGLDVVAHAVRYRDEARRDRLLDYASGVEVYTSRHGPKAAAHFRAYAESKDKHWTASSDDHQRGYVRPPCGTPPRTVERILGRAVPEDWLTAPGEPQAS